MNNNPFGEFTPQVLEAKVNLAKAHEKTEQLKALLRANTKRLKLQFFGITWECHKPANDAIHERLIALGVDLINAETNEKSTRLCDSAAHAPAGLDGESNHQLLEESPKWFTQKRKA